MNEWMSIFEMETKQYFHNDIFMFIQIFLNFYAACDKCKNRVWESAFKMSVILNEMRLSIVLPSSVYHKICILCFLEFMG